MISWGTTVRTASTTALVTLIQRPEWRNGPAGDRLRARLSELLADADPVIRMLALPGLLYTSAEPLTDRQIQTVVIDRLRRETHAYPRSILLNWFTRLLNADPGAADAFLPHLMSGPETSGGEDDDHADVVVRAVLHLHIVHRTTEAARIIEEWTASPVTDSPTARRAVVFTRDYLRPPAASPTVQDRAFSFLSTVTTRVADEYLRQWTAYKLAPLPEVADGVNNAARVAHDIAHAVYFASSAFDVKQQSDAAPLTPDQLSDFDRHARPLLMDLARIQHAEVVHPIVETLVFLAAVDPRATLRDLVQVVPDRTDYVTDSLAADEITGFLRTLMTENRELVLEDTAITEDFRVLLQKVAWAGHPAAVELAYDFSSLFV